MAFNARIFAYRGVRQLPIVAAKQFTSESFFALIQPYEYAETISVSAVAASSAPVAAPNNEAKAKVLYLEIPDQQAVRYEINPPGRAVVASSDSPKAEGRMMFDWGDAWTISLIDAAGLL